MQYRGIKLPITPAIHDPEKDINACIKTNEGGSKEKQYGGEPIALNKLNKKIPFFSLSYLFSKQKQTHN